MQVQSAYNGCLPILLCSQMLTLVWVISRAPVIPVYDLQRVVTTGRTLCFIESWSALCRWLRGASAVWPFILHIFLPAVQQSGLSPHTLLLELHAFVCRFTCGDLR